MRRTPLMVLAGALAVIAAGAVGIFLAVQPVTLSIAVGPANIENHRLVKLFEQLLQRERADVRLRVVTTEGAAASAALLQAGGVELAVVRSDVDYPADGLVIANLRRDVLVFMARPDSEMVGLADLRGATIGVVSAPAANLPLLRRVLGHYGLRDDEVTIRAVSPEEAGASLADRRFAAVFTVANPTGRQLADLVAKLTEALGASPTFLPTAQAEAIARRSPTLEATELVRGAFGGAPARPPESLPSLGIVHRLVAHRTLSESSAATLTQVLFTLRPALAAEYSVASQIEAPDTDRGSLVPVHPGAIQYVEGNIKTFLDRYGDWFYIVVMIVGIVGSAVAGLASMAGSQAQSRRTNDVAGLVDLLAAARIAADKTELDEVEARTDRLFATTLERISSRDLDPAQIAAFTLGFDQVRRAIADRRASLPQPPTRGSLAAAE